MGNFREGISTIISHKKKEDTAQKEKELDLQVIMPCRPVKNLLTYI